MKEKIISRGAEALLIKKGNFLIKRRIRKGYRHQHLDFMLRTGRTRHEARLLRKTASVIKVPRVRAIDGLIKKPLEPETEIEMQFIRGKLLSEWLDKFPATKALKICEKIGRNIALIHDLGIIHGDLTTSNMILKSHDVYFIDFGLGFHSTRAEDKAVDLHLLREALEARHFRRWQRYFEVVLKGYKTSGQANKIIEKLKKVESRGRYKGKAKGRREPLIP